MSTINTNYINNTNRSGVGSSERNLQLGSDGSVTSFEGLSISDAAASNGSNYYRGWNGVNFDEYFPFDRTKYNSLRVMGWADFSYEPSNSGGIGLYIQPAINTTSYTLSQMNGGFIDTFTQTTFDVNVPYFGFDQMVYNTSPNSNSLGYRWVIDHHFIINGGTVWTFPRISTFINLTTGNPQQVVRQLSPSTWNTTNGNDFNTFRLLTNSVTNVSTISKGQLSISLSRTSGFNL